MVIRSKMASLRWLTVGAPPDGIPSSLPCLPLVILPHSPYLVWDFSPWVRLSGVWLLAWYLGFMKDEHGNFRFLKVSLQVFYDTVGAAQVGDRAGRPPFKISCGIGDIGHSHLWKHNLPQTYYILRFRTRRKEGLINLFYIKILAG